MGYRHTTAMFIEKAVKVHGDRYDYSQVNYSLNSIKVTIICKEHGKFYQRPNAHLAGKGCKKCTSQCRKTQSTFVKQAAQVHDGKYDYSKSIYVNALTKLVITCPIHGDFTQTPGDHLRDHGCPQCRNSTGELKIRQYLQNNNIQFEQEKTFDGCKNPRTNFKLRFDFYLPAQNLLIEFDGEQHYKPSSFGSRAADSELHARLLDTQFRDNVKTAYASLAGISLLRIKYTEVRRIPTILARELNLLASAECLSHSLSTGKVAVLS